MLHEADVSVVFFENYSKDVFTTLSTDEINLFYHLLDVAVKNFSGSYHTQFFCATDDMPPDYEITLKKLRSMIMVVNYHDTGVVVEKEDVNLLRRIRFSSDGIYFSFEQEILKAYLEKRTDFDNVFVKIDYALKSKYSKFLYRVLTKYKDSSHTMHYELLLMLMNLSDPKYLAARAYNVFNRDVLKKCVDELNETSDLHILYYPVKNKIDKKIVECITFEIASQIPKKQNIELSEQEEMSIRISQLIEEKAIEQYENAKKYSSIIDKSAYINAIIRKYNREDVEAEIRLKNWLEYTKIEFKPDTDQPALLCIDPYGKNEIITITNDYGLYDMTNNRNLSKKPSSTLKKINNWIKKDEIEIEFKTLGRIYDDYLVSYVNLMP